MHRWITSWWQPGRGSARSSRGETIQDHETKTSRHGTTQLLNAWAEGDSTALEPLMARVYDELQDLAAGYLRRERRHHTLRTSALVHEAFLRLLEQQHLAWQSRGHFLAIAAKMMRRVLLNYSRDRQAAKRGGTTPHLAFEDALEVGASRPDQLVQLDDALSRLARTHPDQAQIVELRFFGGLSQEEIAQIMDISVPTVARRWRLARAWLYRSLCNTP